MALAVHHSGRFMLNMNETLNSLNLLMCSVALGNLQGGLSRTSEKVFEEVVSNVVACTDSH
jgi:hypothetical protein